MVPVYKLIMVSDISKLKLEMLINADNDMQAKKSASFLAQQLAVHHNFYIFSLVQGERIVRDFEAVLRREAVLHEKRIGKVG